MDFLYKKFKLKAYFILQINFLLFYFFKILIYILISKFKLFINNKLKFIKFKFLSILNQYKRLKFV